MADCGHVEVTLGPGNDQATCFNGSCKMVFEVDRDGNDTVRERAGSRVWKRARPVSMPNTTLTIKVDGVPVQRVSGIGTLESAIFVLAPAP